MRSFFVLIFLLAAFAGCPSQSEEGAPCSLPGFVPRGEDPDCILPSGEAGVRICRYTDAGLEPVCREKRIDPQY